MVASWFSTPYFYIYIFIYNCTNIYDGASINDVLALVHYTPPWYSEGVSSTDDTQDLYVHSMKSFRRQHLGQCIYLIARFCRQFSHFPPQHGGPFFFQKKKQEAHGTPAAKIPAGATWLQLETSKNTVVKQGWLNYLFWWEIKQCKCMVVFRGFPVIVHCLGWWCNDPCETEFLLVVALIVCWLFFIFKCFAWRAKWRVCFSQIGFKPLPRCSIVFFKAVFHPTRDVGAKKGKDHFFHHPDLADSRGIWIGQPWLKQKHPNTSIYTLWN